MNDNFSGHLFTAYLSRVETEAQLAHLRHDGCDEVQGYLYGEPVPADEFADLFRERALNMVASTQ